MGLDNLLKLNVNDKTEKKNGLTYLSWAWAWTEFLKEYPNSTYTISKDSDGLPYFGNDAMGYMVYTTVTVDDLTREMWLPVMDGANKAMKFQSYTYKVKEYKFGKWTGEMLEKTCDAIDMFDVNKTIMRCLTKNLAMFGLGLYIYAGEDLPEEQEEAPKTNKKPPKPEPTPEELSDKDAEKIAARKINDIEYAALIETAKATESNLDVLFEKVLHYTGKIKDVNFGTWRKAMDKMEAKAKKTPVNLGL